MNIGANTGLRVLFVCFFNLVYHMAAQTLMRDGEVWERTGLMSNIPPA